MSQRLPAPARLSADELERIAACPVCRSDLTLGDAQQTTCPGCGAEFSRLPHAWDLTPPKDRWSQELWQTWEQLQENGAVSYNEDPERNLGVGEREDCRSFARFAGYGGLVLDVGCGPQEWPAYFTDYSEDTRFVGIDPLIGEREAGYARVRGLAEFLPFGDGVFDRVVFATTLDHFVDPSEALAEAGRVLRPGGWIAAWLGHKRAGAPKPKVTNEWYEQLTRPDGAEDFFHVKRLDDADAKRLFAASGLRVDAEEAHAVDEYRSNFFFRLTPA